MAASVPGARLTRIAAERIEGEMRVALGPIAAVFAGSARLRFDEAAGTASLAGEARDARTGTRLTGRATIRLADEGAATQAMLAVTYALAGPLAQLARGPIVAAVATEIAETVARALERRLAGERSAPARLSAFSLLARALWRRLRRLLRLP
jgi:carbon monoxide dehydrogenase subunit G